MKLTKHLTLLLFSGISCSALVAPLDLVILFDGSGSIDSADYQTELDGIENLINLLPVNSAEVNVALVQFGTSANTTLVFSDSATAITTALGNAPQLSGQTNHADAFTTASNLFADEGRSGAAQFVLLITDGVANEPAGGNPFIDAVAASDTLKDDGVVILGVGIEPDIDSSDLEFYTSSPTGNTTFMYGDFDTFAADSATLRDAIIPEPSTSAFIALPLAALALTTRRRRK